MFLRTLSDLHSALGPQLVHEFQPRLLRVSVVVFSILFRSDLLSPYIRTQIDDAVASVVNDLYACRTIRGPNLAGMGPETSIVELFDMRTDLD